MHSKPLLHFYELFSYQNQEQFLTSKRLIFIARKVKKIYKAFIFTKRVERLIFVHNMKIFANVCF